MKIYPFIVPKTPHQKLVVQIDRGDSFFDKLHQHDEIQLSYIISGYGKLLVLDSIHQYQPGDIFIIGSKNAHLFQSMDSNHESHMISLFFTKYCFGEEFFEMPELKKVLPFFQNCTSSFRLIDNKSEVAKLFLKASRSKDLVRILSFLKLLKKICQSETSPLASFPIQQKLSNSEGHRLQSVFEHVTKNFHREIRLEEASNLVHMTPNAFCRFFKQRTNKTFIQFLIEYRIEHARQLLVENRDLNISQISHRSGFKSITNFNRKFKEQTGFPPSKYNDAHNLGKLAV